MKIGSVTEKIDNYKSVNSAETNRREKDHPETVMNRGPDEGEPSREELSGIVKNLNESVKALHDRVTFSYHEHDERIIIKVKDSQTGEVVREIPSKTLIKLNEHLQEFMGMFVDESR